jgi:CubicO group peptidase (beta-lactamase class C family)
MMTNVSKPVGLRLTRIKMDQKINILISNVSLSDTLFSARKLIYDSALHNVIFMRNVIRHAWITDMKRFIYFLMIIVVGITSCGRRQRGTIQEREAIVGSWKGRQIAKFDRPFSVLNLFSQRPDSSLALTMVFETSPRSRVWSLNADVDVRDGRVHWEEHDGLLSKNKDTMEVTWEEQGGNTDWLFARDRSADSLMMQLTRYTNEPYVYKIPKNENDGWQCADMSQVGIDGSTITKLIDQIRNGEHDDIHSFLIVKDNKLIVEEYFAENGTKHGSFITDLFRNKVHHLASTTKGVTSALVGIAIDQGFIKSVDDPICKYLSSYATLFSEDKKRIKIRDMLTMTPGFEWHQVGVSDDRNDGMRMWGTDDVIGFVLQKPLETEPGKKFNYTNGVPTVTGAIIKNAVGMDVRVFAEKYLFQPLGIVDYVWTSYPDGSIETDGGLALRSRDLAKIGQLFLDKGVWHGEMIISQDWVLESTKERLRFGKSNRWGYGYHWMQAVSQIGDRLVRSYFVPGDGNQIVAVFPELTVVVVFTAGNYGKDPKSIYYSLFKDFILPAVVHQR